MVVATAVVLIGIDSIQLVRSHNSNGNADPSTSHLPNRPPRSARRAPAAAGTRPDLTLVAVVNLSVAKK